MLYHVNSPYYRQFLTSLPKQFKAKKVAASAPAAADEASKEEAAKKADWNTWALFVKIESA